MYASSNVLSAKTLHMEGRNVPTKDVEDNEESNENTAGKHMCIWPLSTKLYNVEDRNLKKKLCLIVRGVPSCWKRDDLVWFFRDYLYRKMLRKEMKYMCLIEQIYLVHNHNAAIIACHDEITHSTLLCLSPLYISYADNEHNSNNVKDTEVFHEENTKIKTYDFYNNVSQNSKTSNENLKENENFHEKEKSEKSLFLTVLPYYYPKNKPFSMSKEEKRIWLSSSSFSPSEHSRYVWPDNLNFESKIPDKLKKKLCLVGFYKPYLWDGSRLLDYIRNYCASLHKDNSHMFVPIISCVYAKSKMHTFMIACKDEKSRYVLLLIKILYLEEKISRKNTEMSLRPWIYFKSYKSSYEKKYFDHLTQQHCDKNVKNTKNKNDLQENKDSLDSLRYEEFVSSSASSASLHDNK